MSPFSKVMRQVCSRFPTSDPFLRSINSLLWPSCIQNWKTDSSNMEHYSSHESRNLPLLSIQSVGICSSEVGGWSINFLHPVMTASLTVPIEPRDNEWCEGFICRTISHNSWMGGCLWYIDMCTNHSLLSIQLWPQQSISIAIKTSSSLQPNCWIHWQIVQGHRSQHAI